MSKGIVRTDNMKATKNGNIVSGKFYDGETEAVVQNGMLVKVDGLVDASADREIYKVVEPENVTDLDIGVVATPELIYDEQLSSTGALKNFENKAGDPVTVLMLAPGDILSVSDECIDAVGDDPAVDNYVTLTANDVKWNEHDSAPSSDETVVGKIIAREKFTSEFMSHGSDSYLNVIRIIEAN